MRKDTTPSKTPSRPPSKVTEVNQPNMELMAKAFTNLYNLQKKSAKIS
jgi:hypothetical protein